MINKLNIYKSRTKYRLNIRLSCLSFVLLFFISSTCMAQSFFGSGMQSNTVQTNQVQSPGSTSNQIMSSDDYKNLVTSLGKQNQDNLTQTSKAQLDKQAPAIEVAPTTNASGANQAPINPGQPPVNANQVPINNTINSSNTPPNSASSPIQAPNAAAIPTTPIQTQSTPLAAPPTTLTTPNIMPTPSVPASAPQNQPYTGFGNFGNSNNAGSTTNSSTGNSNGWNIHY
jgi:hypothetical protein